MSNLDWKTYGIMAGVSLGVFVLATVVKEMAVDPMLEKQKAASRKAKNKNPNAGSQPA